jgi:DNA invertase Pin-like site-specific DNA recombinase
MDNRVKQETVDKMRQLESDGFSTAQIAKKLRCFESTVIACLFNKKRKSYPSDVKKKDSPNEKMFDHKKNKPF